MKNFKIVPLSKGYTDSIRQSGFDGFGNEILEQVANGYGPCRLSLKAFEPGKDLRLLFSHSPFEKENAFNQRGPVFISKEDVEPYADIYNFPPEIKADKKNFPLTLIGYDRDQNMVFSKLVGERYVDELIIEIFENRSNVNYLHARNAEAGCYICKIERVE